MTKDLGTYHVNTGGWIGELKDKRDMGKRGHIK